VIGKIIFKAEKNVTFVFALKVTHQKEKSDMSHGNII
jgi:hypothetical protein